VAEAVMQSDEEASADADVGAGVVDSADGEGNVDENEAENVSN